MEKLQIEVSLRDGIGKEVVKKMRKAGETPAIVYGKGVNTPVKVSTAAMKTLRNAHFSESAIIEMQIAGAADAGRVPVMVKDIQYNPMTEDVIHIDFMKVDLDKKITVHVPLAITGEAKGIKDGGVLEQILWEIEIEALPLDIPEKIEIDVGELTIGHSIHAGNIKPPEGVRITTPAEETLVTLVMHKEEVVEAAEDQIAAAPAGPEVIKEKKDEPKAEGGGDKKSSGGDKKAAK